MSGLSVPGCQVPLLSGGRVLSDTYPGTFSKVPAGQIMVPGWNIPGSTYDVRPPEAAVAVASTAESRIPQNRVEMEDMWPLEVCTDDGLRIRAAGPAAFLRGVRHDIMSVWCKEGATVWIENGSNRDRHSATIKANITEGDDDVQPGPQLAPSTQFLRAQSINTASMAGVGRVRDARHSGFMPRATTTKKNLAKLHGLWLKAFWIPK